MATYVVTEVRKEWAGTGTDRHRHIEGACRSDGSHYTRKQVVDSIYAGNVWKSQADGYEAVISTERYCPHARCLATPYIKTNPDSTKKDNLENLDECEVAPISEPSPSAAPGRQTPSGAVGGDELLWGLPA
jgi:hypothetical protein